MLNLGLPKREKQEFMDFLIYRACSEYRASSEYTDR
jgi:hypothetical protein